MENKKEYTEVFIGDLRFGDEGLEQYVGNGEWLLLEMDETIDVLIKECQRFSLPVKIMRIFDKHIDGDDTTVDDTDPTTLN